MKLTFDKKSQGDAIPKFYGVAWYNYWKDYAVVLPIPLNIIARIFYWIYLYMKDPAGNSPLDKHYRLGMSDGYKRAQDRIRELENRVNEAEDFAYKKAIRDLRNTIVSYSEKTISHS